MRFPLLLLSLSLSLPGIAQTQSDTSRTWRMVGGGPDNIHYSTLNQINRENVHSLQVAWRFDSGDEHPKSEMECNPIVVDGVLYATTPNGDVVALDAATGELHWRFDANEGLKNIGKVRNRGVTYWSEGNERRIFVGVRQYLYALDAQTGKPVAEFGKDGRIDLRMGLGREPLNWVTMTSPAAVYKDLVIVGGAMSEVLPASPGDIRAFDAHTGKLRWSFHTIPHPGEFGYNTWPKNAWTYSGAANNWAGMTIDYRRGIIFAPTGSAASDFYGANRVGNDLFANCLLALNAETGKRIWYFQFVHHDIWDRDPPSAPALVTVKHDGKDVDAVVQTTKQGFLFVFDRETGKPLFPIANHKYPPSELEGEVTAKEQPLPELPAPFARQKLTADMITTRTPEAHQEALDRFLKVRSDGQFIPGSTQGTIIFPGFDGGAEWGGGAFDPTTGLFYVNSNEMAWILRLVPQKPRTGEANGRDIYLRNCATCHRADRQGAPPEFPSLIGVGDRYEEGMVKQLISQGAGRMPGFARLGHDQLEAVFEYVYYGKEKVVKDAGPSPLDAKYVSDGYNKFLDKDGYPAIQPPWGTLTAINLNSGTTLWHIPLGNYPELAAQGLTDTGSENYGGPVVTAGGLLFIGATSYDKVFRALDKTTGKVLWQTTLPAAGNATPCTYEVNGRQYVVIAAGGGKSPAPSGGSLVAFALPK
ncbi:MAG TPA: PQQ-binding-like beta-propeller repeat protein [Acidobacteriaceae bacterium]|nr:PQQ-binding-like beta-propeller repeat protein [Acidobacteriaceae bacterium]